MRVNTGLNLTVWRKQKRNNLNCWIYCYVKSTLSVSVSVTIIRTWISGEFFTQRWMLVEITEANNIYTTKRWKRAHSVLLNREGYVHILISMSWWRLLKLKRLTLTLQHNKFNNLDILFFCFLHIYIYIYIYLSSNNKFSPVKFSRLSCKQFVSNVIPPIFLRLPNMLVVLVVVYFITSENTPPKYIGVKYIFYFF